MLVCKYKFNNTLYDLIPIFNDGYNGYTISDEKDGEVTTRTIECDTLPTMIKFSDGDASNNTPSNMTLSLLELIDIDTSNVTDMGYMFFKCNNVTSICAEKFDTSKCISMYYMFALCASLQSLDVSSWNVSLVKSMSSIFSSCSSLTSLNINNLL